MLDATRFPEGDYVLTMREAQERFCAQQRTFHVDKEPIFEKALEFNQASYAPGQEVKALGRARRVAGTFLADREVHVTVEIDGQAYDAQGKPLAAGQSFGKATTDADGKVRITFRLPEPLEKGDARLTLEFVDGNNRETLVRRIPVSLVRRHVAFYPEGGPLVPEVMNRVYFEGARRWAIPSHCMATWWTIRAR